MGPETSNLIHWAGEENSKLPLFLTIPHSGEVVPPEATWLKDVPKSILATDVDSCVDQLYAKAIKEIPLPALITNVHRYVVDLNRFPADIDRSSVVGAKEPAGKHQKGFHWVVTTKGAPLLTTPLTLEQHQKISQLYYKPFHDEIKHKFKALEKKFPNKPIYHLDCHSMPSVGTLAHRDPGKTRAEIVISDLKGKSASPEFKDLVFEAFKIQKFEVAYNWPYFGGRITKRYGSIKKNHFTVQIELNRSLYIDEDTKQVLPDFNLLQERLFKAMKHICDHLY